MHINYAVKLTFSKQSCPAPVCMVSNKNREKVEILSHWWRLCYFHAPHCLISRYKWALPPVPSPIRFPVFLTRNTQCNLKLISLYTGTSHHVDVKLPIVFNKRLVKLWIFNEWLSWASTPLAIFHFDNVNILNCTLKDSLGLTMKDKGHNLRPLQVWQFVGNITSCN